MNLINFRDSGIQGAIVTLFVLIVAVVIAKAQDFVHFSELAFAAAFVFVTLFVSCSVTIYFLKKILQEWSIFSEDLKGAMGNLDKRFDIVATTAKADWLVANEHLMQIEKKVKCKSVWIITASLEEEIEDSLFAPIIQANLKKGIKYRYLIPDEPILRQRGENLKAKLDDFEGITLEFISDPLFKIVSMQDVAIYITDSGSRAYMNLPIREGGTSYFIELGRSQTETLVGYLKQYLDHQRLPVSATH